MKNPVPALSVLVACAALGAQGSFTSPINHEQIEGASSSVSTHFAYYAASRGQYIDANQKGTPRPNIKGLRLRRNGNTGPVTTYTARTVEVGVVLAHTNAAAISTTFATNYLNNLSTQVYTVKATNLPSHVNAVPTIPAPWSITIPFDTMFSYNGTDDFLYEITGRNNSAPVTAYSLDAITSGVAAGGGNGAFYYNGLNACTVTGRTSVFDIYTRNPVTDSTGRVTIDHWADDGPSSSPAALGLGLKDPNLVGVFCAPLRTSVDIAIPAMTDANGLIASSTAPQRLSFLLPAGLGLQIYTQYAAVDVPNMRLYLSDAAALGCVPYLASFTPTVTRMMNTTSDTALTGTSSTSLILVTRFDY
jgi:hypothetical protein